MIDLIETILINELINDLFDQRMFDQLFVTFVLTGQSKCVLVTLGLAHPKTENQFRVQNPQKHVF